MHPAANHIGVFGVSSAENEVTGKAEYRVLAPPSDDKFPKVISGSTLVFILPQRKRNCPLITTAHTSFTAFTTTRLCKLRAVQFKKSLEKLFRSNSHVPICSGKGGGKSSDSRRASVPCADHFNSRNSSDATSPHESSNGDFRFGNGQKAETRKRYSLQLQTQPLTRHVAAGKKNGLGAQTKEELKAAQRAAGSARKGQRNMRNSFKP